MSFLTNSWAADGLIFLLTVVITAYFYITRNFQYWKKRGVVEIPPAPFFGNFTKWCTLKISPGYLLKSFYEQHENVPYVGIYIADKPCLLLRDLEIIKQVLIKDFNTFSDKLMRSSESDDLSNNSLILIKNPDWKYIKSKLTGLFTSKKLKNIFESLRDVRKDLDNFMDTLELDGFGKRINVKELCAKFTTDVIGHTILGLKLNSLTDSKAEFRKTGKIMTGILSTMRLIEFSCTCLVPQIATLFNFRFFEKNGTEFFKNALQQTLKERETSKIKRNDLIDLLIQLRDNDEYHSKDSGFKFEGDNLLAQVIIFFLAGYDASALAMTLTLYELARHQDVQTKLRREINDVIQNNKGEITYSLVTDVQYLDMVVSETLRMYPVLPIIDRKATADYTIEKTGLIIEKGTPILIPMLGLHYDQKYFTNPNIFDPEHFSDFNKSTRNPYVYMPFGIGPRSCIGMRQGLLQTKLGIAHIISKFEVTPSKDSLAEIDPKGYFTSFKKDLFLNVRKIVKNKY